MEIRPAVACDLPRIMDIYDAARAFMRSHGNTVQWVGGYPSRRLVEAGIEEGGQYVCTLEGRIVATFWFAVAPEPTYAQIFDGAWLDDKPYGVVHRLGSDGTVKGVGEICLDACLAKCGNIRVDTHSENGVMQRLLTRAGYVKCGVIFVGDGTPRDAFQKTGDNY